MTVDDGYALFIHCAGCGSGHDLDEQAPVASAEVATFVAAHQGHEHLSFHLRLPASPRGDHGGTRVMSDE